MVEMFKIYFKYFDFFAGCITSKILLYNWLGYDIAKQSALDRHKCPPHSWKAESKIVVTSNDTKVHLHNVKDTLNQS